VRVNVPGGAPFFRIEAARRKGKGALKQGALPWAEIERAAGRLRTKMLFPEGVQPPALALPGEQRSAAQAQLEPGLRAFAPRRLPLLLCLRAAQEALRLSHLPARELRVTVVDQKGLLCRSLEPLVPLAGSLRVYTPDFGQYRAAAAQLLRRHGVTLILSDSPACFAQSHVVIADDLSLFTGRESGLVFTPDAVTARPGCRAVRMRGPILPGACESLCPPGIDPLLFACALYELCGVKEMERLRFGHYAFDGVSREFSMEELAASVGSRAVAAGGR